MPLAEWNTTVKFLIVLFEDMFFELDNRISEELFDLFSS